MGSEARPITLQQLLAERLRALRLAHHATQADVARGALALGLYWTRSTVAAIEAGRRALRLEELLLLPAIVGIGYGAACRLGELLGPSGESQGFPDWRDERIALTPFVEASLSEIVHALESPTWTGIPLSPGSSELGCAASALAASADLGRRVDRIRRDALGLAEHHAADRLGISPLAVSLAADRPRALDVPSGGAADA
jgi:transcriptional regulator with XRE-family HTH domain